MNSHPYAHLAPRLPEGEFVDPRQLVASGGQPVELEIGPGRGGFMFERLLSHPAVCLIGLEIRLKWAALVDQRLRDTGFGARARVYAEDARRAVRRFPDACFKAVFVNFPDPWWKKRHRKRLVVDRAFASELLRVLCSEGEVFVQTDVEERAHLYQGILDGIPELRPVQASARVTDNPFAAQSPRERRALADGLPIFRLHYRKMRVSEGSLASPHPSTLT